VNDRAPAINFYELISGKDIVDLGFRRCRHLRCRTRCSLADHGVPDGFGDGAGLLSFFFSPSSGFGSWRISVRLGPCVVNCPFEFTTMTVSGLVAMCVFTPSWTRGVPRSSTLPVEAT